MSRRNKGQLIRNWIDERIAGRPKPPFGVRLDDNGPNPEQLHKRGEYGSFFRAVLRDGSSEWYFDDAAERRRFMKKHGGEKL